MSPAIAALLDRIDPDRTLAATLPADALDDTLARRLAIALIARGRPAPDPADGLLDAIVALHRREDGGETVAAGEWRALRRAAVAMADGAGESLAEAVKLAEAAAWPVAGSRAALTDILTALGPAAVAVAVAATGWTPADQLRAHTILDAILAEDPTAHRSTIPPRFEAAEPELSRRFVAQLIAGNTTLLSLDAAILATLRALAAGEPVPQDIVPLIPRLHLFGNPARVAAQISPDGAWIGWIEPVDGVRNVRIAPRDAPDEARTLTHDRHRGIGGFLWAEDGAHILYAQDRDGDEIFHVHATAIADGATRDLVPLPGVRVSIVAVSRRRPGTVVLAVNDRAAGWPDLWRVDIATGVRDLLCASDRIGGFFLDEDFIPRAASRIGTDGGFTLLRPDGNGWRDWMAFAPEDARTSRPLGLDAAAETFYLLDSRGRDTAALVAIDLASDTATVLLEDARADVGGTLADGTTYRPLAAYVTVARRELHVLDDSIRPDLDAIARAGIGDWSLTSRSRDDRWWVLVAGSDLRPGTTWLYDRDTRTVTALFEGRPELRPAPLVPMHAHTIAARDGRALTSYLTLPLGDGRNLPLVLLVHGGPWVRDHWGYSAEHQWLANRGYAVLSVNFRGSSGFGKDFLLAGDGQWGAAMDNDLDDAVDWAIARGIADPGRIAIMGTSYGGYAVLSGLTKRPGRYACGVDVVGPANLETLLAATPPHWESQRARLWQAVGNPDTDDGRAMLRDRSPLHRAGRIADPLLIGQGANDPRVPQAEPDQMVAAMRGHGVPVNYILFPDEGHGFSRPDNAVAFRIATEAFLSLHLGGRMEPARAEECAGSSGIAVEIEPALRALVPLGLAAPEPSGR